MRPKELWTRPDDGATRAQAAMTLPWDSVNAWRRVEKSSCLIPSCKTRKRFCTILSLFKEENAKKNCQD